jgi:hypothetical protein
MVEDGEVGEATDPGPEIIVHTPEPTVGAFAPKVAVLAHTV